MTTRPNPFGWLPAKSRHYLGAVAAVVVAVGVRLLIEPVLGQGAPFAFMFLAVLLVARTSGLRPAMLAMVLGGFASAYYVLPPRGALGVHQPEDRVSLVVYAAVGAGIAMLGGSARSARARLESIATAASRQEERMRTTLASIGDGVLLVDGSARVALMNPVAERLTGLGGGDALGRPSTEVFRIVDERTRAPIEPSAGLEPFEALLISAQGGEVPVELSTSPVVDDRGGVDGVVMVFRDVSARRRHEAARLESDALFRQLAESIPQLAWMAGPDGRATWYNQRWYDYTGTSFEQMQDPEGRLKVHHPDHVERVVTRYRDCVARGEPWEDVFPVRGVGGEFRWHLSRMNPWKDEAGRVVRWFGTSTDISEERRLLREREIFSALVANSGDFIGVFDPDGAASFVNDAGLRLVGLPGPVEAANARVADFFFPEDRDFIVDRFLPGVVERGRGEVEVRFRHFATGEPIWMLYSAFAVLDPRGEPLGLATVSRDVTARKRVEDEIRAAKEEAEQANRAKDQFLAVLSHELRTPLNPVLLAASSIADCPPEADELKPMLGMIRDNVHLQARLIDDLLDVMRIARGKLSLRTGPVDAHDLIRRAVEVCRGELSGRRQSLSLDLAAESPVVEADDARLQQVVWNLVKNASKFTPEGGSIAIWTRTEAAPEGVEGPRSWFLFEILDDGIGIDPAILPLVFDPFQQGESNITRKYGGLGLGLAICRGVVDALGGTLTAESLGEGRGTTFRFRLPNSAAPLPAPVPSPSPSAPLPAPADAPNADPGSLRVLLVEDEPATLRLMARLLRGIGHHVTPAGTFAEGLAEAEAAPFDLIVSDVGLPDGTGIDLIRRVTRSRGPVRAIALTGFGMAEDVENCLRAGFSAHMTKPIDFQDLDALIRRVVHEPPLAEAPAAP